MRKLTWLVAIIAVVPAGCRLDARVGLDIAEDGTGTTVVEIGIDDELLAAMTEFPVFDADRILGALGGAGDDIQVEQRREADTTYFTTTTKFASIGELQDTIASLAAVDVGALSVDMTDEGASFQGRINPTEIVATVNGVGLLDLVALEDSVGLSIDVGLPGDLITHDADQVLPDGTLRWVVAIDAETSMSATTSFATGGTPAWLIAIIATVVVAVGGFLALGRTRGSRGRDALASTPPPAAPRGFDDA